MVTTLLSLLAVLYIMSCIYLRINLSRSIYFSLSILKALLCSVNPALTRNVCLHIPLAIKSLTIRLPRQAYAI